MAFKYILADGELYRRTAEELLLKCLDSDQVGIAMGEVHEGIYGTHQFLIYWPSMMTDCFRYYKGCEECQWFSDIRLVPAALLHPIIKPWLFQGWGLDFIGQINPPSSEGPLHVSCYGLFQ